MRKLIRYNSVMLACLRYALATVCFAASVGGLALWRWSATHEHQRFVASYRTTTRAINANVIDGVTYVGVGTRRSRAKITKRLEFSAAQMHGLTLRFYPAFIETYGYFGAGDGSVHFPLWYPALIFALAGVAALRLGRRFTLRTAIIATTVMAGLLGMAVIL